MHANAAGGDETEAEDTAPDEQQFVYSPDREGIRAAVQDARVQIAECYSGWAKADTAGELVGRASIRFAITPPDDPDATELARLRDVTIDESTRGLPKHGFLDGCIINAFESLRFDPPTGTMNVTYPIDFAQE